LEIGLVHRTRREYAHASLVVTIERGELGLKSLEEWRQALHLERPIDVGQRARQLKAVLKCVAGARGRLGAVAQHPPVAVPRAPDVHGVKPKMPAAPRGTPPQRPQEFRIAGN